MLPWKQTSVLSERMRLVERYALGEESLAELSRQLGISRKTAYKTIRRHDVYGELGLLDLSRAPHHRPNATAPELAVPIVGTQEDHCPASTHRAWQALASSKHGRVDSGPRRTGEVSAAQAAERPME